MEQVTWKSFASLNIFKTRLDNILTAVVWSCDGTCFEQEDGGVMLQIMSVYYTIHICDICTACFVLVQVQGQAWWASISWIHIVQ